MAPEQKYEVDVDEFEANLHSYLNEYEFHDANIMAIEDEAQEYYAKLCEEC